MGHDHQAGDVARCDHATSESPDETSGIDVASTHPPSGAPARTGRPDAAGTSPGLDRRAMLARLAGGAAIAWATPQIVFTRHAAAATLSGCVDTYDFDDGTLQGWTEAGSGQARWQISALHPSSGSFSAWFGRSTTHDSLHPIVGEPSYRSNPSARSTLTSPMMQVAATDVVGFDVRLAIESSPSYDTFRLSIRQGSTRRLLWDKSDGGFAVIPHPEFPAAVYDLYTTHGSYTTQSVTIGTPSGIDLANPVQFEFDVQTVDGNYNRTEGIYLDNIVLPCQPTARSLAPAGSDPGGRPAMVAAQADLPPDQTAPEREAPPRTAG